MREEEYTEVRLPSNEFDRIEKAVVDLYKKLRLDQVPLDPFVIASKLGFLVKKYSDLPMDTQIYLKNNEREGVSLFDPDIGTFVICYDDNISYSRIRFTIMHEIGHIMLGHREESVLAKRMADYYAAYSLAPSPLIRKFKCEDYLDISNTFDVSQECAYCCFCRYYKWLHQGGNNKPYENELLDLFHK